RILVSDWSSDVCSSDLGAVDGELLDHVNILAAAVVAPARIAFGIFIGQQCAGGVEHGTRYDILGGDQLDLVLLPLELVFDGGKDLGVGVLQMLGEELFPACLGTPHLTCRHGHCSSSSNPPYPAIREDESRLVGPRGCSLQYLAGSTTCREGAPATPKALAARNSQSSGPRRRHRPGYDQ